MAIELRANGRLVATRILSLHAQIEEMLRSEDLLNAAEHLDVYLIEAALPKIFLLRLDLELSEARGVRLHGGDRRTLGFLAKPKLHIAIRRGAAIGIDRGRENTILQAGRQFAPFR